MLVCTCGFSGIIQAANPAPPAAPAAVKEKHLWQGQLRAGTAKIDITPENTKYPVHDKVHALVLVFEIGTNRLAFVSVDLGIYTSEHLISACKENSGCRRSC